MRSPARVRPHKTPVERAEILTAYRQTSLSSHAFAREHGIAPSTLFRWLRHAAAPRERDAGAWIEVPNLLGRQTPPPAYCLRFAQGVSLEIASGFKADEVRALAEVVRDL